MKREYFENTIKLQLFKIRKKKKISGKIITAASYTIIYRNE